MQTITFLKVRAFQLSKRHISTCKITQMVHWVSLLRYVFNMVYEGKNLLWKMEILRKDVIGINEWYSKKRYRNCRPTVTTLYYIKFSN